MKPIYPNKLQKGDEVRVIAPALSLAIISKETREISKRRFDELGLKLTFGKHVNEADEFMSSSIESRIPDLHDAFSDKNVKGIFTVLGGFNSNQLLEYIDWNLISNNPKIFCGFSDITALNNAIYAKTGLVTYSGPHYSTFGQKLYFDYTLEYVKKCLMQTDPFDVAPSKDWFDDLWFIDQNKREQIKNDGFWSIQEGEAKGTILGANLCTFNLLQGTPYMPDIINSVLFLEDDVESKHHTFDRDLQSVIHLPEFNEVRGLVIGRFQKESKITRESLNQIIASKKELSQIPVIGNADFGHTDPKITFPIGGKVSLEVSNSKVSLTITEH
jgi:muramoyltetrapeptide carboxypeptidase LdcA involved in peptidoglycan recycling